MDNTVQSYQPRFSPEQIQAMATAVVKSRLFPQITSAEAAMTLFLLCDAEGIHPMMALRRYDIINGRPAMKTDAMLAEFQKRGGKVEWVRLDEECVEAIFMANGLSKPVRIKFDSADAKRAGLLNKDNWVKYPRAMRRARVVSEGVRTADPGVNAGVYTPEEVADFEAPQDQERPKVSVALSSWAATAPKVAPEAHAEPVEAILDAPVDTERPAVLMSHEELEPPTDPFEDAPSPLFNGGDKGTTEPPSRCTAPNCNGAITLHFSDSKRFPKRPYYQCAKAYDEKLRLMAEEGMTNAKANLLVQTHYRDWAGPWKVGVKDDAGGSGAPLDSLDQPHN